MVCYVIISRIITRTEGTFLGGPMVKTLPSNAADKGLIPGQRAKVPHIKGYSPPKKKTEQEHDGNN